MIVSCVLIQNVEPSGAHAMTTWIPPPGAVCPATVRYGLFTLIGLRRRIVPLTVNTQVRGPRAPMQARSEPEPESARLVTGMTRPPRPPRLSAPPPSAPGNARVSPGGGLEVVEPD